MPRSRRSWWETADSLTPSSVGDVADAQLAAAERVEDADAGRVAEDLEGLGDVADRAAGITPAASGRAARIEVRRLAQLEAATVRAELSMVNI